MKPTGRAAELSERLGHPNMRVSRTPKRPVISVAEIGYVRRF
jgi:hypothetical protein